MAREMANAVKNKTGKKIFSIPCMDEVNLEDLQFGDKQLYDVGPSEFLSYIKNAAYVITDSFHGTVFSVLFNKQFAVYNRYNNNNKNSTNSRIDTLLMKIELENCQKSLTLKDFEEVESKLGHVLPERLKEFYLQYNGGEPKQQTISINKYYEVEIRIFQPFKYNKSFKNALFHTVEGETLEHRSSNSISDNILLFASGHNNLRNIGVIAINIKNRAVYFYKIIGFVKNSDAFIFDEPQLIADSIDDFFNNLVAFPKIEEEQQTEIIEIEGVMPELSDCSASLTKEDIKNFEVELNVKIPAGMKNFYLKFNGGMPSPYCFQPQDEDLDWVEINAFFPIKERTNAFETIEVIAKDMWSRNLMPSNLLPFAMDSGGNYYALNLKNKKIYYYLTDEWDENASREYNFETNTRYIAQSFNYFINHFIEEEE